MQTLQNWKALVSTRRQRWDVPAMPGSSTALKGLSDSYGELKQTKIVSEQAQNIDLAKNILEHARLNVRSSCWVLGFHRIPP